MVGSSGTLASPQPLYTDKASFQGTCTKARAPHRLHHRTYFSPTSADTTWISGCASSPSSTYGVFNPCTDAGSGDNQVVGQLLTAPSYSSSTIVISGSTSSDPYTRDLYVSVQSPTGWVSLTPSAIVVSGSFSEDLTVPAGALPTTTCAVGSTSCSYVVEFELTTFVTSTLHDSWSVVLGIAGS